MRNLFIASVVLLGACTQVSNVNNKSVPPASKTVNVSLEESLGTISISLPSRYDTTFTWVHYSDCGKPCEKRKYRYQQKRWPIFPETGYSYKALTDSVDQFTIVHNPYIPVDEVDKPDNKSFIVSFHDHKKWNIIHDPAFRTITSDTIEKIRDRYYSIIIIDRYDTASKEYSKKLMATTTIRAGTIDFNFDLLRKQNDSITQNFLDDARAYLRTIHIEAKTK